MLSNLSKFSVSALLLVPVAVGIFLRWDAWWIMTIVVHGIFLFVLTEIVVRNLPRALRQLVRDNIVRLDRSRSRRRARIEKAAMKRLAWDFRLVSLLATAPYSIIYWSTKSDMEIRACALFAWSFIAVAFFSGAYMHLVKRFDREAQIRALNYELQDAANREEAANRDAKGNNRRDPNKDRARALKASLDFASSPSSPSP